MGVVSSLRASFSLQAYAASLLVAVGAIAPLPLLAQSTAGSNSPFCQLLEAQGPFLSFDTVPASDEEFRAAIAQGRLDEPCNFYGERWQPLNFLLASQTQEIQIELIQAAIAQGADVNGQDGNGNTPLHYARFEAEAQLLIDNGANVNGQNNSGDTPLHNLYGDKSRQVMQLLLDHGADINARSQGQFTPLHKATTETVELLLASGADINARTDQNYTPLHYAITIPAVAIPLIEAGADLTLQNDQGAPIHASSMEPAVLTALLDAGVDVNLTNQQGETPLHRHRFNYELTQILIDRGADVNAQDSRGWTPLFDVNIEVARQLVAAGADLTLQDNQGRTALHQAVIEENSYWGTELTELFLSQSGSNALLAMRDNNGETALDIARRLGKTEIIAQLQAVTGNSEANVLAAATDQTTATLEQLLRAQDWAAADRETRRLLDPYSVPNATAPANPVVAPELIRAIDQAWLAASDGRFGLSVQLRLWQAAVAAHPNDEEAAVNAFRDRVGWKIPAPRQEVDFISSDWRNESELTYSLDAPEGHLPWAGVSDEVVQDVAVPGPDEHCGSCTIDAMDLRNGRFYRYIPQLMDRVALDPPAASSWRSPRLRHSLDLAALYPGGAQGAQAGPVAFAISPDSQLLAVSSSSGDPTNRRHALALWNLETGTRRITLLRPGSLRAETVAFSPNSQALWAGLANGDLASWETSRGAPVKQWNAHQGEVSAIAIDRPGTSIYTGSTDGTVKIWSPTGQLYTTLQLSAGEANPSPVRALMLSPNGRQLAVATDRTIQLWNPDGQLIKVTTRTTAQTALPYSPALANSMAFSPDGRYFATLDTDRSVKLWNASSGARVITLRTPDPAQALAFTRDGQTLLVRDTQNSVVYWNLETYQRDRTISVTTGNSFEPIDTNEATALQQPITLSPDGQTFVVPLMLPSSQPALDVRRTDTGERLTVLDWVSEAGFSPDNRWLVTQGYTVQIWQP